MAVVLLSVDGQDNASGALNRVASSVSGLDRSFSGLSASAARVQSAVSAQEAAYGRLDSAQIRVMSSSIRQAETTQRASSAMESYNRYLQSVTSSGEVNARTMARLDSLWQASISSQNRAASATDATARAYRQLASAQDTVISSGNRVNRAMGTVGTTPATSGAAAERGGSMIPGGGFLLSVVGYSAAFMALSTVTGQLSQAFTRATATARTLAMTEATTGISHDTATSLGTYISKLASSGTQPYTRDVLATGLYAIPSAGVQDAAAIKAINDVGVKISAFTGSQDTATVNTALIQTMSELGITDKQMASQVGKVGDVITGLVNLGIVSPQQVAPNVSKFGSVAAQYGVSFSESAGIMAALTKTAPNADIAALQTARTITSIGAPNRGQQEAAADLGVSNLLGQSGIKFFTTDLKGYLQELNQAVRANPGKDIAALYGNRLATAGIEGLSGPGGASIGRTINTVNTVGRTGSTNVAANIYNASDVAKMDAANARFKTAVDTFAQAAIPLATSMLSFASDFLGGGANSKGEPNSEAAINKALGTQNLPPFMQTWGHWGDVAAGALGLGNYNQTVPKVGPVKSGEVTPPAELARLAAQDASDMALRKAQLGNLAGLAPFTVAPRAAAQGGASTPAGGGFFSGGWAGGGGGVTNPGQATLDARHGLNKNANHIAVADANDRLMLAIEEKGTRTQIISALGIDLQAIREDNSLSGVKKTLQSRAAQSLVAQALNTQSAGPVVAPFKANNPGLGALEATPGNTLLRFGGGRDPLVEENRKLRQEVVSLQHQQLALLAQIAGNTARNVGVAASNALTGIGANKNFRGR